MASLDERLCLESMGHKVALHADLARALDNILNDPPDLLMLEKGLAEGVELDIIRSLKENLQLAFLPILLVVERMELAVGLDWDAYAVDDILSAKATVEEVIARVELALARMRRVADNNPLTKLPGNSSILKTIQGVLDAGAPMAVGYVDIDNFKPYNDRYGFSRGDEVIRMLARILVNVVDEAAGEDGFVGHVGGDDFVFVVPLEAAERVCRETIRNFDRLIPLFLDEPDLEAGCFVAADRRGNRCEFPLTSVSIAVVVNADGRYSHYGEVAAVAAQLKKKVKAETGSAYLVDRRVADNGPPPA
ncbi:diguanylate cyclase [Dissulfurirhabdus thermomarina]|uniref:Diguanylate cyclase n=2 Tax=Dissulfurirhabdus thermomarina TaxID=1765737 RepID=A0A6N9TRW7_DISTH|nr:diguanylate cyclase [Dissulfurirhabdus thermomarina]NDY42197.1 diguanylate cyclase [Dissulfurirhabdus thermomarina]NMX22675.1 diguanylate cyclase [Dissulfurirhabdus thermomarina]